MLVAVWTQFVVERANQPANELNTYTKNVCFNALKSVAFSIPTIWPYVWNVSLIIPVTWCWLCYILCFWDHVSTNKSTIDLCFVYTWKLYKKACIWLWNNTNGYSSSQFLRINKMIYAAIHFLSMQWKWNDWAMCTHISFQTIKFHIYWRIKDPWIYCINKSHEKINEFRVVFVDTTDWVDTIV